MKIELTPLTWKKNLAYRVCSIEEYLSFKKGRGNKTYARIEKVINNINLQTIFVNNEPLWGKIIVPEGRTVEYLTSEVRENHDWWEIVQVMEPFIKERYVGYLTSDKKQSRAEREQRLNKRQNKKTQHLNKDVEETLVIFSKQHGFLFDKPQKIEDDEGNAYSSRENNQIISECNYEIEQILYEETKEYTPTLQTIVSVFHGYMRDTSPIIGNFFQVFSDENYNRGLPLSTTISQNENQGEIIGRIFSGESMKSILHNFPSIKNQYEESHLQKLLSSLEYNFAMKLSENSNNLLDHAFPMKLVIEPKNLWSDMVFRLIKSSSQSRICKICRNEKCGKPFTAERSNQEYCSRNKGKVSCKKQQNQYVYRNKNK